MGLLLQPVEEPLFCLDGLYTHPVISSGQVTIWEALTNSKPGTHPFPCNPCQLERSDIQLCVSCHFHTSPLVFYNSSALTFSFVHADRIDKGRELTCKLKPKSIFSFLFPPPGLCRTSPAPRAPFSPVPLRRGHPPAATTRNCASPWRCQPESKKGRSFSSHTRGDTSSNSSSCHQPRNGHGGPTRGPEARAKVNPAS